MLDMGNKHPSNLFCLGSRDSKDQNKRLHGDGWGAVSEESPRPPGGPSPQSGLPQVATQEQPLTATRNAENPSSSQPRWLTKYRSKAAPEKHNTSNARSTNTSTTEVSGNATALCKLPRTLVLRIESDANHSSKNGKSRLAPSLPSLGILRAGSPGSSLSASHSFLRNSSTLVKSSGCAGSSKNASRQFAPDVTSNEGADEMANPTAIALGAFVVQKRADKSCYAKDISVPDFRPTKENDTGSFSVRKPPHRCRRTLESEKDLTMLKQQQPQSEHQEPQRQKALGPGHQNPSQPMKQNPLIGAREQLPLYRQPQQLPPSEQQQPPLFKQQQPLLPRINQQPRDQQQKQRQQTYREQQWGSGRAAVTTSSEWGWPSPRPRNNLLMKKTEQPIDNVVRGQKGKKAHFCITVERRTLPDVLVQVPRVNYTCRSGDVVADIALLAREFQEEKRWTFLRKSWSWPALKMAFCVDDAESVVKGACVPKTRCDGVQKPELPGDPRSNKKAHRKSRKKNLHFTRQTRHLTGLEDKVADTSLHIASTPGMSLKDLETCNKFLRQQLNELVRIKTNLCSYRHLLEVGGLAGGLDPEILDQMKRAHSDWLEAHATSIHKLRTHVKRWLSVHESTGRDQEDDPRLLEQDKRDLSAWIHTVIARGHQLDQRLASYLLEHKVYDSEPSHRGCCECRCPVTVEECTRQQLAAHLIKETKPRIKNLPLAQTNGECPSPQPKRTVQRTKDSPKTATLHGAEKACSTVDGTNPAFSIVGHYDDFHINGIREKKAEVSVCIRKQKRWRMSSTDIYDPSSSKEQADRKKSGGVRGRERPERNKGDISPGPGRRSKRHQKGIANNRKQRAKALRKEKVRVKT